MDEDLKRLADKFGMDSSGRRIRRVTLEFVYDDEHDLDDEGERPRAVYEILRRREGRRVDLSPGHRRRPCIQLRHR